tara:strand:- start:357 stop:707 length:351 start_codon:yes stop_codon:yes gene_type:complete
MKCQICSIELNTNDNISNSRNISVKLSNGNIVCIPCHEAISFFSDLNKVSPIKKEEKVKKKEVKSSSISKVTCSNRSCNNTYSGSKCDKCGTINILLLRKTNNKKKKKKKKKKKST